MPFMVIYNTSDGSSCHEQADAIDEAALVVERLRNQDGIEEIRIYRMEEISFAFRPYYKVELGMPELVVTTPPPPEVFGPSLVAPTTDEPRAEVAPPVDLQPAPTADLPADAPPSAATDADGGPDANGRRGLFGR